MARPKLGADRLVSVPAAAERLGCSEATVWRRLHDGTLPRRKLSDGMTRIPLSAIDALIAGQSDRKAS